LFGFLLFSLLFFFFFFSGIVSDLGGKECCEVFVKCHTVVGDSSILSYFSDLLITTLLMQVTQFIQRSTGHDNHYFSGKFPQFILYLRIYANCEPFCSKLLNTMVARFIQESTNDFGKIVQVAQIIHESTDGKARIIHLAQIIHESTDGEARIIHLAQFIHGSTIVSDIYGCSLTLCICFLSRVSALADCTTHVLNASFQNFVRLCLIQVSRFIHKSTSKSNRILRVAQIIQESNKEEARIIHLAQFIRMRNAFGKFYSCIRIYIFYVLFRVLTHNGFVNFVRDDVSLNPDLPLSIQVA